MISNGIKQPDVMNCFDTRRAGSELRRVIGLCPVPAVLNAKGGGPEYTPLAATASSKSYVI